MKAKYFVVLIVTIFFVAYLFVGNSGLESRFNNNEKDFQNAADAYMEGKNYNGVKWWLTTMPPGERAEYLPFHMGSDYISDYYDPRIVYIFSDNPDAAGLCSFDGRLIKKIKYQWYICQESRF